VRVVRAAGYREHRIAGLPPFALLHLLEALPGWLTGPMFKRELRAMQMSSMTQDVVLRGAQDTELELITGYTVQRGAGPLQPRDISPGQGDVSSGIRAPPVRGCPGRGRTRARGRRHTGSGLGL